jgi:hypothetical protein
VQDTKRKSTLQEKHVAKEVGGRTTPASGAMWGCKGDVRSDIFLVECKTTEKDKYSLTITTWDKIRVEAVKDGMKIPVMCIDLCNGKYRYAVFEYFPVDIEWVYKVPVEVFTNKSSHSIKVGVEEIVHFKNRMTVKNGFKDVVLSVIPWSTFLEYYKVIWGIQ